LKNEVGGEMMFDYFTAGESHGQAVIAIIKDVPSGLSIRSEMINEELIRRQQGYGRGGRMEIEEDRVQIKSGVRHGLTLGSPITLIIENKDWQNWQKIMAIEPDKKKVQGQQKKMTTPRPGHADLSGALKYNFKDIRNILERSSARETAVRSAVGAVCKQFLKQFGYDIKSHVVQIGEVKTANYSNLDDDMDSYFQRVENSQLRCGDHKKEKKMRELIDRWRTNGDSVGGVIEIIVFGVNVGLGSHIHWDKKLDAKLSQALISIQAIKGIEFGAGFDMASLPGSKVHDKIYYQKEKSGGKFYRKTNRAGGFEGGITNGQPLIMRIVMKPIPTLKNPLHSVDLDNKKECFASKERADVCAVPSASIVGEGVVASVLAKAFTDKFGGDSMKEITNNHKSYQRYIQNY